LKIIKVTAYLLSLFLSCIILYSNYNLYYAPELISISGIEVDGDLVKQLNYLEKSLDGGTAYEMQKRYPEGFFFSYLMYGLSWCEIAKDLPEETSLKIKSVKEALKSLVNLESDYCKKNFSRDLSLPYGAFYFSWTNYLRAKILALSNNFPNRHNLAKDLRNGCDSISLALSISKSPFLESYPNQFWPADILPGIASLAIHDKLFETKYNKVIKDWFEKVESNSEKRQGLFPHSVDRSGKMLQNERGSSFGLILIMLKEIPGIYSESLLQFYIGTYLTYFVGLPMIREFAPSIDGGEDVDSGPIIFGNGSVATIVGAGVFRRYGILNISQKMFQTIECVGFPFEDRTEKKYLLGKFPIADFFIAWSKSLQTLEYKSSNSDSDSYWRMSFHLISFGVIILLLLPLFKSMKLFAKHL
jgi:hypothetical protein